MKRDNLIFGMFRFLVIVGLVAVVLLYTKEFAVKAYDYGKRIVNEPPVSDPEKEEVKTITVPIPEVYDKEGEQHAQKEDASHERGAVRDRGP